MDDYIVQGFQEYVKLVQTNKDIQGLTICAMAYILFFTIFCIFYKRLENMVYNLKMNKWFVMLSFNIGTILVSLAVYGFTRITQIQMRQCLPFVIILSMIEIAINFLSVAKFKDEEGYISARFRDSKVGLTICLNIIILASSV